MKYQNLMGDNTKYVLRFLKEYKLYNSNIACNINKEVIEICKRLKNFNALIQVITLMVYGKNYSIGSRIKLSRNFEKFYFKIKYNKTKEELFDIFLKQNRLYTKFYNNTKILEPFSEDSIAYHHRLGTMINDAFEWNKTKEGQEFWTNAHNKLAEYEKYLLGYENNYIITKKNKKINNM